VNVNLERTVQLLAQRLADAELRECMSMSYIETLEGRIKTLEEEHVAQERNAKAFRPSEATVPGT